MEVFYFQDGCPTAHIWYNGSTTTGYSDIGYNKFKMYTTITWIAILFSVTYSLTPAEGYYSPTTSYPSGIYYRIDLMKSYY